MDPINWKPMPDCPGYLVSYRGDVYSEKTRQHLKLSVDPKGRLRANLSISGKRKGVIVGRMVLRAFGGEPPTPKHIACHNDGDPTHNHIDNLRWATYADNCADMVRHGTRLHGERHQNAKLSRAKIEEMRALYKSGVKQPDLAKRFGVEVGTVNRALCGRTYKGLAIAAALGWEKTNE